MASILNDLTELKDKLMVIEDEMNCKIDSLNKEEKEFEEIDKKVQNNLLTCPKIAKFNIGGKIFATYTKYLAQHKGSLFYYLLAQDNVDFSNEIYFERNPKYFEEILNYFKHKTFNKTKYNTSQLSEITREAEYFELKEMEKFVKSDI